jgi:hypothetical protein
MSDAFRVRGAKIESRTAEWFTDIDTRIAEIGARDEMKEI